jgi:hypothetical protein
MGTQQAPARAKARGEHGTAWVAAKREAGERDRGGPASRDASQARGMPVQGGVSMRPKKSNRGGSGGV